MQRIHVMLKVHDLDESIAFYSRLFGVGPTMQRADYAKWMLEDPRVNFSMAPANGSGAGIEHLGIQAESPDELSVLRGRIAEAGGEVFEEGETVCCHHRSDKTWVTDAQGISWEAFFTSGVADAADSPPAGSQASGRPAPTGKAGACCADDCCT